MDSQIGGVRDVCFQKNAEDILARTTNAEVLRRIDGDRKLVTMLKKEKLYILAKYSAT